MTVVYYKINYLPVGVRIWFQVNFGGRVFRVKVLLYKLTFLQFVQGVAKRLVNFESLELTYF